MMKVFKGWGIGWNSRGRRRLRPVNRPKGSYPRIILGMPQDDDDARLSGFVDEPHVPDGPRRSTFTPLPSGTDPGGPELDWIAHTTSSHDDDELASALAEQVSQYTASNPVVQQSVGSEPLEPVADSGGEPAENELAQPASPVSSALPFEPVAPAAVEYSVLPPRPQRRSLQDDELLLVLGQETQESTSTIEVIDQLASQLQLREAEAREFQVWESAMLSIGTAQALEQVEETRTEFTGVIPLVELSHVGATSGLKLPSSASGSDAVEAPREDSEADEVIQAPVELIESPQGLNTLSALPNDDGEIDDGAGSDDGDRAFRALLAAPPFTPMDSLVVYPDDAEETAAIATHPGVFGPEASGPEPTPLDRRVGRAARLFWLWFAANSTVLAVAVGATVFSLGMSLRQSVIAILVGIALSILPLGLGTLAAKRSGQPTMIVSRATFGLIGNVLPAALALLTRIFWGAVLLWLIAVVTVAILVQSKLNGDLSSFQLTTVTLAISFLIAVFVAYFGYVLIAWIQLVLSVISGILIIGFIALTWQSVHISVALSTGDGPWILVVTGAVLVFSFAGLVWANSSGDLARYQRLGSSGAGSMLWATFGVTVPTFILISYGALLAASNSTNAAGLISDPVRAIAALLPSWYPVPLIAAIVLSLLSGVIVSIYSGGFALQAIGIRIRRQSSIVFVALALAVVTVILTFSVGDFDRIFRDLATSLAVPVAAWAGIFASEMMIRNRRFSSRSLLKSGGIYPAFNWVNLSMLVVAAVVGYGLTTASVGWLHWQGYLFPLFGVSASSDVAATDIGVLVALALGLLTPIVAGVPAIRRQERTELLVEEHQQDQVLDAPN
jgi:purine-cytosine permease-like protein